MTINDFFDSFYLPYRPSTSPRTIRLYRYTFRKFGEWLGRESLIADLTNPNLGNYLRALLGSGLAPSSVNKERRQLCCIWRHAHTIGHLSVGPIVQPVKEPYKIPTSLTVPQLKQLRLAFDDLQGSTGGIPNSDFLRACFSIQYATAARVGAVMALEFSDVQEDVITFRAETRKGGRRPMVKRVPPFVVASIEAIRSPVRTRIFPLEKTNATKVQILYGRLFERAGVPRPKGKNSHLFRSTHATLLELAGGDATKALGHANRDVTVKSYLDPRFRADRDCDLLPDLDD